MLSFFLAESAPKLPVAFRFFPSSFIASVDFVLQSKSRKIANYISVPGTLYIVATPIGNLADISARALETLRTADVIACEDTRHTRKLLSFYDIRGHLISYHEHNEALKSEKLCELLGEGKTIALVSDAGTPAINDPGHHLVQKAISAGIRIVPIPGPAAFINALVASGLPTDAFFFGGFLPSRKGERRKRLEEARGIPATLIFYEAPHRLKNSLADCLEVLGNRPAAIARELTKIHEEILRGNLADLAADAAAITARGEIVLVIGREEIADAPEKRNASVKTLVGELESRGITRKAALKMAARELGIGKSEAYRRFQAEEFAESANAKGSAKKKTR